MNGGGPVSAVSVRRLVSALEREYGTSEWWPSKSSFEVAVGAILTQRTSWNNVEMAIENLRSAGMLTPNAISAHCGDGTLETLIRPSGFYRQKARYLRTFSSYLMSRWEGDMDRMRRLPVQELRDELMAIEGVGPETADTMLLYALSMPSFVVDSYTFRLLERLHIHSGKDYLRVKRMFEDSLGLDHARLSSAHAAIVNHCKERCKVKPQCGGCPLRLECPSESH